jgi:RNA polymerase primary sigma factor
VVRKFNQTSEKLEGTSDMNNIACYLGVPIEIIERALEATREIHSLNEITDASEPNFEEPECQTAGPLDLLIQKCLFAEIRSLLFELATREREVLSLRFGLTGEGEQTLEEVGCVFGVTRERIRQIEKRALVRLSESSSTRKMQDYLESYTRVDDTAQHTEGTNTDAS